MVDPLSITEREGVGLAIIQARKGVGHEAIGRVLGLDLPTGPGRVGDDRLSALGTGPGTWFLISEDAAGDWAEHLARMLDGLAAVFDQSSGYIVLRLSGAAAQTVLQSGAPIDLDGGSFGPSSSASTSIAHVAVLLWRKDDTTFDLSFYRSYRESLQHWLSGAVAAL